MVGRGGFVSAGRGESLKRYLAEKGVRKQEKPEDSSSAENGKKEEGKSQNGSNGSHQNSKVPSSEPGVGRGSFLSKLKKDINSGSSSSSSSSSNKSPPEGSSPNDLLAKLSLSDSTPSPLLFRGECGEKIDVITNYFFLEFEQDRGVFQYHVKFDPEVDSKQMRMRLIRQLKHVLQQTINFDGAILYLPFKLPNEVTEATSEMTDGTKVQVKVTFVKQMRMGDPLCIHLYNSLFRRIMSLLGYIEHGRNFYDPNPETTKRIPEQKLSVWPGVITSIQDYEGGVMLMCDASHRVLRDETVLELMEDIIHRCNGEGIWQEEFSNLVSGQVVLTYYNNKTYKIDDVQFDRSPCDGFMKNGVKISYIDYYKQHYDVDITDRGQPLLVSKVKSKVRGETIENTVDLIPELCRLSGITDSMRSDFHVMKSIIQCTRIAPSARQLLLEKFLTTLNNNADAKQVLADWGLRLANRNMSINGRVLPEETVYAANGQGTVNHNCNWTKHIVNKGVISAIHLQGWTVVCTNRDEPSVRDMVLSFQESGRRMGINVHHPTYRTLPNDHLNGYIKEIQRLSADQQIVVVVLPLARKDKYTQVKKACCLDNPIPSQVVIAKTIRDKRKLRSIAQKILMQMNCKVGGTLWSVPIPMTNVMIIGLDTFHDPSRKQNSVGAVVASLNPEYTRWYSRIYRQNDSRELIDGFEIAVTQCLERSKQVAGNLPKRLVIYRDGLGDSQLEACSKFEVTQLKRACLRFAPDYNPELLFIVVQKRINTRMLYQRGREVLNAPPGTVMDHTVTRKDKQDFFLVSQNVTEGTVTPTHYVILNNETTLSPDKIQRITYKLTHLYYNWSGTIRVPAPCQYAHKLASLVGEHLGGREADDSLRDKLFYL